MEWLNWAIPEGAAAEEGGGVDNYPPTHTHIHTYTCILSRSHLISHISSQSNTTFVIIFPPLTNVFYGSSLALMAKTVPTSPFVKGIPVLTE